MGVRELMPGFWDKKVCGHCGAPAHLLGTLIVNHDGSEEYKSIPVVLGHKSTEHFGTVEVDRKDIGAVRLAERSGKRSDFEVADSRFGLVYTHECMGDWLGKSSCGVLTANMVRPAPREMHPVCWYQSGERLTIDEMRQAMREHMRSWTGARA